MKNGIHTVFVIDQAQGTACIGNRLYGDIIAAGKNDQYPYC
jgi:hypothetical protein